MNKSCKESDLKANRALTVPIRYVVAPMVQASDLAFRLLCRKYGADTCYTPMWMASHFVKNKTYQTNFNTVPEDRPLIVQFAANNPLTLTKAVLLVQDRCDAVDLNLGCPQQRALDDKFGACLLQPEHHQLVFSMVTAVATHPDIKVPITCKIRLLPDLEDTIAFCKALEAHGCSMIAVHGRKPGSEKNRRGGLADLSAVAAVKAAVKIPVLVNGNTTTMVDVKHNLDITSCDGLMSAEGVLHNPALFSGMRPTDYPSHYWGSVSSVDGAGAVEDDDEKIVDSLRLALEYVALAQKHNTPVTWVISHLRRMVYHTIKQYQVLHDVKHANNVAEVEALLIRCLLRRESGTYTWDAKLHLQQEKRQREYLKGLEREQAKPILKGKRKGRKRKLPRDAYGRN